MLRFPWRADTWLAPYQPCTALQPTKFPVCPDPTWSALGLLGRAQPPIFIAATLRRREHASHTISRFHHRDWKFGKRRAGRTVMVCKSVENSAMADSQWLSEIAIICTLKGPPGVGQPKLDLPKSLHQISLSAIQRSLPIWTQPYRIHRALCSPS